MIPETLSIETINKPLLIDVLYLQKVPFWFYPTDLVNTETTIPLRVGEQHTIYTSTLRVSVYTHTTIHLPFGG